MLLRQRGISSLLGRESDNRVQHESGRHAYLMAVRLYNLLLAGIGD